MRVHELDLRRWWLLTPYRHRAFCLRLRPPGNLLLQTADHLCLLDLPDRLGLHPR
jgi:hypothetical protein